MRGMPKMSRKRRNNDDATIESPWMNTYGDMVTLLLTFFVLLFSFSTIDAEKWRALVTSLRGGRSVIGVEESSLIKTEKNSKGSDINPTDITIVEDEILAKMAEEEAAKAAAEAEAAKAAAEAEAAKAAAQKPKTATQNTKTTNNTTKKVTKAETVKTENPKPPASKKPEEKPKQEIKTPGANDVAPNEGTVTPENADKFADLFKDLSDYVAEKSIGDGVYIYKGNNSVTIRFIGSIMFESGSATINESAKKILRDIASIINKHIDSISFIESQGHTDNVPPPEGSKYKDNWELSGDRSYNVLQEIIKQTKINPKNIKFSGFGSEQPIASNDTGEGRAKNNRVDIIIT